jgi:hypothetical protein
MSSVTAGTNCTKESPCQQIRLPHNIPQTLYVPLVITAKPCSTPFLTLAHTHRPRDRLHDARDGATTCRHPPACQGM